MSDNSIDPVIQWAGTGPVVDPPPLEPPGSRFRPRLGPPRPPKVWDTDAYAELFA